MIIENPNYKMNISVVISLCVVFLLCCEKTAARNDWAVFAFRPFKNPNPAKVNVSETEVSYKDLFKYVRQYSKRGIVVAILYDKLTFYDYKYCSKSSNIGATHNNTSSRYSESCFRYLQNKTYGMKVMNPNKALNLIKEKASTYYYQFTTHYSLGKNGSFRCLANSLYVFRLDESKLNDPIFLDDSDEKLHDLIKRIDSYCPNNAFLVMNSLSSDLKNVRISKNKYLERRECGWAILGSKFAICAGRMILVFETPVCRRIKVSNETFYFTGMSAKWNDRKRSGTANLTTSIYDVKIEVKEHKDDLFHLTTMQVGQHLFRLDLEATKSKSNYCPYNLKFFTKPLDNGTAVHLILTSFYFTGRSDDAILFNKPVNFKTSTPCSKTSSHTRKSICLFGCLTGCNKNILG